MDPKKIIIELGELLANEKEAAYNLWTWLPSYKVAQKHHGDYATEFCPSVKDIMVEAAMFIGDQMDITKASAENLEWYNTCPCGQGCEMGPEEGEEPARGGKA